MVGPTHERPGHSELMCGDRCVALGSSRVPLSRRPAHALKMFDESHRASSESEALGLPPGRQSECPCLLHSTGSMNLLTVQGASTPVVADHERYKLAALGEGYYKLIISFGYLEEPHLLPVLRAVSQAKGLSLDFDSATYYVGHETIVASEAGNINRIPQMIFSYLNRNAVHEERHYGMPTDQIVEIGTQIDL